MRFAIMFFPIIVTLVALMIALVLANRPFESRSADASANITHVLEQPRKPQAASRNICPCHEMV